MKTKRLISHCGIEFQFQCPMEWELLSTTAEEDIRFCRKCEKNVYFCHSDEEVAAHAKVNHCIARELPYQDKLPRRFIGKVKAPRSSDHD